MKSALLKFLLVLAGIGLLLAAASCSTTRIPVATDARIDSALTAAGIPPLGFRKVKITGNVYLQVGHTNTVTDNTNAGRKGAAATAAGATASAQKAGLPWQVYAGGALVLLVGGFYARGKFKGPLPI